MRRAVRGLGALLLAPVLGAQTVALEPLAVTAARMPAPAAQGPFSLVRLDGETLRAAPSATLDGALRSVPGFSLFRRSDSFTANPTAQGLSLRGLGPSGASRSLVLLDSVPLNDPFGGWVAWSQVPREALAGAELVRGGGATAWGNAALGGVVQLLTESAGQPRARLAATLGDFSTRSAEFSFNQPLGAGTLQLAGRDFATDGFKLVAPEDRGPVDVAAWSRHHWLGARWTQTVGERATLTVTGRTFAEKRGNGTAYQRNSSTSDSGSVALAVAPTGGFGWTALAYGQDQSFASTFSAVNATRTAETPASDQFAVPATALGAAWTGAWTQDDARTSAGIDLRRVRGETRENFTFSNGDFARQRITGGTQAFAGLFALHERAVGPHWHATLGVRFDGWREAGGHRRETDRASGSGLRADHYPDRAGREFSPSAGLVWTPAPEWRLHAAAQQSFRRPTLNELYRPFRAGNVITEANAGLRTERATSGELGVAWSRPPQSDGSPHGTYLAPYPLSRLKFGATVFWNELRDAVGNVTIAHGPGTFPIVGFVPAGGTGRQRLNLDRLRVQGLELTAEWRVGRTFSLTAAYLYDDAVVRRATPAPALAGKRLAQVPRHGATFGATWRTSGGVTLTPRVRVIGRQFEDDENQLILGTAVIADWGASYPVGRGEIFLTIENLGNARLETGRSADGLVNTGTPRFASGGFRHAW